MAGVKIISRQNPKHCPRDFCRSVFCVWGEFWLPHETLRTACMSGPIQSQWNTLEAGQTDRICISVPQTAHIQKVRYPSMSMYDTVSTSLINIVALPPELVPISALGEPENCLHCAYKPEATPPIKQRAGHSDCPAS